MRLIIFILLWLVYFVLIIFTEHYWLAFFAAVLSDMILNGSIGLERRTTSQSKQNANFNKEEPVYHAADYESAYRVLGLDPTASESEIKYAYRKLAKAYHPDVCSDPDTTTQFMIIQEAYETIRAQRGMK